MRGIRDALHLAFERSGQRRVPDAAPAWLPSWADSGVSYENNQAYFGGTLITDLSAIHGASALPPFAGEFDQSAVSAAGMAVLTGNTNRPCATGAFLARLSTLDFTFLAHFDTSTDTISNGVFMLITDANGTGGGLAAEWSASHHLNVTDFNNGSFNTVGTIGTSEEYKLCGSNTASGWLSSLSGIASVLDSPQSVETITQASIGFESPGSPHGILEGHVRSIFFGPVTTVAADIEARAAVSHPVNTVLPAITGTPTVGEQLTVSNGTWLNNPVSYARQWRRDGVDIGGATAATYTLQPEDEATVISCRVVATNADGPGGGIATAVGPIDPAP